MELYTDRLSSSCDRNINNVTSNVWNGLLAIIEKYKSNNSLSISFPQTCYDNEGIVCGFDSNLFYNSLNGFIPNIHTPFQTVSIVDDELSSLLSEVSGLPSTEDMMDLIEFIFYNISDFKITNHHEYFQHDHIRKIDGMQNKHLFLDDVNYLFKRNSLAYELNQEGKIIRLFGQPETLLLSNPITSNDSILNNLIGEAYKKILSHQESERRIALEKLWDAFERLKTIYSNEGLDKKNSANKVIDTLSHGCFAFDDLLQDEFEALRDIGNSFRIRHSEQSQNELTDSSQIDYLFFRMASIVNLFLVNYNGRP